MKTNPSRKEKTEAVAREARNRRRAKRHAEFFAPLRAPKSNALRESAKAAARAL